MTKIKKSFKTGDKVRIQLAMDHHHGREGVVETMNGGNAAVRFDDNARSFYKPEELKMEEAFDDGQEDSFPELDIYSAMIEVTEKSDIQIELETAYTWTSRACAVFQLAALSPDLETKYRLMDWGDDLEHEALEHAALVKDYGKTVEKCQMAIESYKDGLSDDSMSGIRKSQPNSSNVHVPGMLGNEDKIKKEKAHNTSNIDELKSALKILNESLDKFLDEEKDEGVEKDNEVPDEEVNPNTVGEYEDPDTNPDMYPDLDNLGAKVLKDEYDQATASDDNETDGLYDMQQLVEGMDWELEHTTIIPEEAQEIATQQLEIDPDHYKKLRLQADGSDDVLAKDTNQTEEDPFANEGYNLDLGSGQTRQPGYLGLDLYPYDHGTIVHDLHLGIPFPDSSVNKLRLCNSLHTMDVLKDDPKPLLSEIHRVMMPGGQFLYEGPNEIYNYPQWAADYPGFVLTNHEDGVQKDMDQEGYPVRQEFTRLATPDPATANDAEPRIGVSQFDQLPADALLAVDALGYYWSDSTSSGRGNRIHGYPSQGALLDKGMGSAGGGGWSNTLLSEGPSKKLSYYRKDQMAEMNDDGNGNAMTLPEQQVHDAFHKPPVNPLKPPRIKKSKMEKGGPGSGPHAGSGKKDRTKELKDKLHSAMRNTMAAQTLHASAGSSHSRQNLRSAKRLEDKARSDFHNYTSYSTKSIEKGGPGSGPQGGGEHLNALNHTPSPMNTAQNSRNKAQVEHDRKENERKADKIREQAKRNVMAYTRQAMHDSRKSVEKILKSEKIIPIMKMDNAKQIVYGVVLAPNEIDAQDDFMEPEDIEAAAHKYLSESRVIGKNHSDPIHAVPVESFIAPEDFEVSGQYGPQPVKKGSWVLGVKVNDPEEWQKIVDGDYTGFSVGGVGSRQQT